MTFLCIGEMIGDIIIHPVSSVEFDNGSTQVENIEIKSGGDALNNSINLSRLGNQVTYVGRIGRDAIGDYLLGVGRNEGINMDYAVRSELTPHSKMTILINQEGERSFLYYPGTSAEFSIEDVNLTLLDTCKFLQIGGTFHLPRFDGEGAAKLLALAKQKGIVTSMDVTHDFSGRWNKILEPCYKYLDYFLPSIEQAEIIAGTKDIPEIANTFLNQGVKNVVIKLGKQGSYFRNKKKALYLSSYDVPFVDSTGAGDSFVSGFLTGLEKGFEIEDCMKFATAAAAFTVQSIGAISERMNYKLIEDFMKNEEELIISHETIVN